MSSARIKSFAPATIGNISCGYDILGMAVEAPGDTVTIKELEQSVVKIKSIRGDRGVLPLEVEKNTAGVVALEYIKQFNLDKGVEIELEKNMPMGSGLGSSAASAAATLKAIDELFGGLATSKQLLKIGMQAESIACGAQHADNIAPALFGGIVLVRNNLDADVISLNVPGDLVCIVVHPHLEIRTEDARRILPENIGLDQAVRQWGNIAGLVSGFYKEDYKLIGRSLQDYIIEPVRAKLIPGFNKVKAGALAEGALGCSISGSGPSVFALTELNQKAEYIGKKMQEIFLEEGLKSDLWISKINRTGAKLI